MDSETRNCQNCKKDFNIEPDDFGFYQKINVPPPTFCPECRMMRRMAWRNERSFYKRKCDLSGESIISVFSPDKPYKVYSSKAWWSDEWDGSTYGLEYDFDRNFFEQFDVLLKKVPLMNLYGLHTTVVNSEYTNMVSNLKNSYMVTYADFSENCVYGSFVNNSKDCVDNSMINKGELCYETVNCQRCYRTYFSVDCDDCVDVMFSKNCVGCSDCFGCANLRKQKYCIWNKQHSKEEYERFMNSITPFSRSGVKEYREKAEKFWLGFPVKYMHGYHNTNVSGDYIYNSKNAHGCYVVGDLEDCKYCSYVTPDAGGLKNSYDSTHFVIQSELIYESLQSGHLASNVLFSFLAITNVDHVEYSFMMTNCQYCFGCVGLKKKKYCIFNKQYNKDTYLKMRERIIDEMDKNPYVSKSGAVYKYGEFFPPELSPFGYNETSAQGLMPLEKESALKKGYKWYDKVENKYEFSVSSKDLPQTIKEVSDDILKDVIKCETSGRAYRITGFELKFLRNLGLPLPQEHPDVRHDKRRRFINKPFFYNRKCAKCGVKIFTAYEPDRPEIVYCEPCYQKEVF